MHPLNHFLKSTMLVLHTFPKEEGSFPEMLTLSDPSDVLPHPDEYFGF